MSTREKVLKTASGYITGPRQEAYGPPEINFKKIASGWSEIFGIKITNSQVALAMAWLKIARMSHDHAVKDFEGFMDSGVDCAGYMALAVELAEEKPGFIPGQ